MSSSGDDVQTRTWNNVRYEDGEFKGFMLWNVVFKPTSKGSLVLNDSDPFADPIIDLNFMDTEEDRQNLYEITKVATDVMKTRPFQEIGVEPDEPRLERCVKAGHQLWSDSYYKCIAETESESEWHYCCTAAMGRRSNPMAVVDGRLRVFGTRKLRVIDGSVMPTVTRANTNVPCMVIGERGAQILIEDWNLS